MRIQYVVREYSAAQHWLPALTPAVSLGSPPGQRHPGHKCHQAMSSLALAREERGHWGCGQLATPRVGVAAAAVRARCQGLGTAVSHSMSLVDFSFGLSMYSLSSALNLVV